MWTKGPLEKNQKNEVYEMADDIFKFGLVMLASAIGSFDILDLYQQLFENLKQLSEDIVKQNKENNKLCCLIHSEEFIQQFNQNDTTKKQQYLTIKRLLLESHRFTSDFNDFLCKCLQINYAKRFTVEQLLNHRFLHNNHLQGPILSLREVIKVSVDWNKHDELPVEYQGASEKQLDRLCDGLNLVLPNCERWFKSSQYQYYVRKMMNLSKDSEVITNLANDLGLQPQKVYDKIYQIFLQ